MPYFEHDLIQFTELKLVQVQPQYRLQTSHVAPTQYPNQNIAKSTVVVGVRTHCMNFNFPYEKFQVHPKEQSMYQTIVALGSFVSITHNISCLFNRTQIVGTFFSLFISSACTSDYKGFTANIYWSPSFRIMWIHKKNIYAMIVWVWDTVDEKLWDENEMIPHIRHFLHILVEVQALCPLFYAEQEKWSLWFTHFFFGVAAQVKHNYWPFHFLIEGLCGEVVSWILNDAQVEWGDDRNSAKNLIQRGWEKERESVVIWWFVWDFFLSRRDDQIKWNM